MTLFPARRHVRIGLLFAAAAVAAAVGAATAWPARPPLGILLAALLAGGLGLALGVPGLPAGLPRRAASLSVVAALLSLGLAAFGTSLDDTAPGGTARDLLLERARQMETEFARLLRDLAVPAARLGELPHSAAYAAELEPQTGLFDLVEGVFRDSPLAGPRAGLALLRPDGAPVAWAGATSTVPSTAGVQAAGGSARYLLSDSRVASRIFLLSPVGRSGNMLAAEYLLRSREERTLPSEVFRGMETSRGGVTVRFQDFRRPRLEMEGVFRGKDDRYWGSTASGPAPLSFPLRAPDGEILGVVTLAAPLAEAELEAIAAHRAAAAALLAALAMAVPGIAGATAWARRLRRPGSAGRPGGPAPASRAGLPDVGAALAAGAALSAALWGVRGILAGDAVAASASRMALFDVERFGSLALGGLLRSPGDLLLTGVAALLQAALAVMLLRHLTARWWTRRLAEARTRAPARRQIAWFVAVVAVGYAVGLAYGALVRLVVAGARLDLLELRLAHPGLERTALLVGLLLFLEAGLLVLAAVGCLAATSAGWGRPRTAGLLCLPASAPAPLLALAGAAVAALICFPILVDARETAVRGLFEGNLMEAALRQGSIRREALLRSAETLEQDETLGEILASGIPQDRRSLAFDYWLRTELADQGFDSSLFLLDAAGRVVDEFTLNLPLVGHRGPFLSDPYDVPEEVFPVGDGERRVLHAHRIILFQGEPVGHVLLHVRNEYTNLPFLSASDPYSQVFRAARRPAPEEIASEGIVLFVYGNDGAVSASSAGLAPPLPPGVGRPLPPGDWHRVQAPGGTKFDLLYAAGPAGELLALGHPAPDLLRRGGDLVRLLLLAVGATLAVFLAVLLARPRRWRLGAVVEWLGQSFYRKLFANLLAASLPPLLLLAVVLDGFVGREIRKEILAQGRSRLEVAHRILTRVADPRSPEAVAITDETLLQLRDAVGEDLHVFVDEQLLATSRRDLVSAGILPPRLNPRTYRDLHLDGKALSEVPEVLAGLDLTLVAAPLHLTNLGPHATLALPVGLRPADVDSRVATVGEAILLATGLMILLLGAAGYLVARRLSGPVLRLASATRRLAAGDLDARVETAARDEVAQLVGSFNDMALALKHREEELRSNLIYIERILRNATAGVISLDEDGRVVTVNPAAQRLLQKGGPLRPGAELPAFLGPAPGLGELAAALQRALQLPGDELHTEVDLAGDGEAVRRIRVALVPFPLEERRSGRIVLLEDITDVVRSNRLAAWAEMARRIAHEIKNPLTPIQLAVRHLQRTWERHGGGQDGMTRFSGTLRECLAIILDQAARLRQISAEFSDYARIPQLRRQPVAPATLLDEVLRPYRATLPQGLRLEEEVEPGLPVVPMDPDLIRRSLENLVENALQAMPQGGRLDLRARQVSRNGTAWLEIAVSDTGVGMDEAALRRVFEPYFSTKETGTGLGLAIARKAVEEHGGEIRAESQPGRGTTFLVWLPIPALGPPAEA